MLNDEDRAEIAEIARNVMINALADAPDIQGLAARVSIMHEEIRHVRSMSNDNYAMMSHAFEHLSRKLEEHDARFDRIDQRLDGHDARFEGIEARFDGLEARFDGLEGRFDRLEVRFDTLEGRFDGLEVRFDTLEGRFDGLEGNFDEFRTETRENFRQILLRLPPAS